MSCCQFVEQGGATVDTPGVGETLLISLAGVKLLAYGAGSCVQCLAELFTEQTVDGMSAKRVCMSLLFTDASLNTMQSYSIHASRVELFA